MGFVNSKKPFLSSYLQLKRVFDFQNHVHANFKFKKIPSLEDFPIISPKDVFENPWKELILIVQLYSTNQDLSY